MHGILTGELPLKITSQMPRNGVIFSDGIEDDYLEFNAGAELTVTTARDKARLVVPPTVSVDVAH